MRRYRLVSTVGLAIVLSAVLGGLFGRNALATDDKIPDHYRTFTAALSAIEASYVDTVESDRLVYSAVRGMLQTLDPHSSFMDPTEYARMRERQEGRYYGLGIQIVSIDGDITAQQVFEGSPAHKRGVRRGDVIANINGEDAKGWTTEQAMRKLRGPRGTTVQLAIRRFGYEQPVNLEVARDEITIPTIPAYFMADATTGYIQLRDFGENTDRDLKQALRELAASGMRRAIVDLRNNPGGPLDQAIRVSNEFLPKGKMIVYTRGRVANSDQDYRATADSDYTEIPLVVMVNRSSASASEIVSGALQDHDRGYIVGETTFGKALVQSIYRISGGSGVALTTAHYYTPSGRLIQRPWDETFDEYQLYALKDQDANRPHNPADLKRTTGGRPVYSGGGIEPDQRLNGDVEGFNPTRFGRTLQARQEFETYAQKYSAEGETRFGGGSGRKYVKPNFIVDDAMLADFREHLKARNFRIDEDGFAKDLEFIKGMIRFRIDEALFSVAEARRHLVEVDPQVRLAMGSFGEAEKLIQLSRATVKAAR